MILEYLCRRPDAKDTLEGIAEWWRPESHPAHGVAEVEEALAFLTERGHLVERSLGGTRLYAADPRRMDEFAALIRALRRR